MILTVYEVVCHRHEGGSMANWAIWARVTKELSQVLLVLYSALNPLAYCGDLVLKNTFKKIIKECGCCCCKKELSDIEIMESYGITVRGIDSIEKQLEDLDPQSRILSGLKPAAIRT